MPSGWAVACAAGDALELVRDDGSSERVALPRASRPHGVVNRAPDAFVVTDPEGVKPHIAYMSQQFGLYQDLTVLENIHFYADLYRVPKAERPSRLERLFALH